MKGLFNVVQELAINPQLASLIEGNALLVKQLTAKEKRIQFLEFILQQRTAATVAKFNPKDHDAMYNRVYQVFLARPSVGLSYEDVEEAFEEDYRFHSANTGQRVRDLFRDGLVWKAEDEKGRMRYYLKLEK